MEENDLRHGRTGKQFVRYVVPNILGVVGMSAYYFADTYFIAQAAGADGLTALNLILPFFYFIYGIGDMLGIGAATRFTIERARGNDSAADKCLGNSLGYGILLGIGFGILGWLQAENLMRLCGADEGIVAVGGNYLRIVLLSAWAFMGATIVNSFIRNDGAPRLSMAAMLVSAFYNIVFDYVFIVVLDLGMIGAALATVTAPVVGLCICLGHFFSKRNTLKINVNFLPEQLKDSVMLGTSGFMAEMSSCVLMVLYNSLFLYYVGNIGVAAYGIIANLATMSAAMFTGLSQGVQPLMSFYHGCGDYIRRRKVLRLSLLAGVGIAVIIIAVLNLLDNETVALFNRDANPFLAEYAVHGIHMYFPGFVFAGYNVVVSGYFAATEASKLAMTISFLRGFVVITAVSVVLSQLFGANGIWLSFAVSELIVAVIVSGVLHNSK